MPLLGLEFCNSGTSGFHIYCLGKHHIKTCSAVQIPASQTEFKTSLAPSRVPCKALSQPQICCNDHSPVTVPLSPHAMEVPFWLLLRFDNFSTHQMYSTTETHLPLLLHQNIFTSIVEHSIKLLSNLLPTGAGNGIAHIRRCWAAQVLQ